jgi:uncharacterized membrane protein SpoIIM required for sporulation
MLPGYAGIVGPLLITIVMTPVVYRIFIMEEEVERLEAEHKTRKTFWDRHDEAIKVFSFFFIGNFLAIMAIVVLLPESFVAVAFAPQLADIAAIQAIAGAALAKPILTIVVLNNLKVMLFAFALSFLLGTGAIFILSWNASILALYLGDFIRQGLYAEFLIRTAGIIPHAPIEIAAYFLAGIAGGMLSVGVMREKLRSPEFRLVLRDSLIMLSLGILAVGLGALVEVYF